MYAIRSYYAITSYNVCYTKLLRWGVGSGDRVAYIAPNTHAHLEGYYAVPQLEAVIVPLNYRLLPSDWVYMSYNFV